MPIVCLSYAFIFKVHAALPLTTVATPLMWKLLDLFGIAKILVVFTRYRQVDCSFTLQFQNTLYSICSNSFGTHTKVPPEMISIHGLKFTTAELI